MLTLEHFLGEGPYIFEGKKKLLDCASGTFNLALGYNFPSLVQALQEQLGRCAHLSSEFTSPFSGEIRDALLPYLPPGLSACWMRDITGSMAVEGSIRIAQKATGKSEVVSLFMSHHGQSLAATAISGNAFRRKNFSTLGIDSLKIAGPACKSCFYEKTPDSCNNYCARALDGYLEFASSGQVAALILEPVLGNGGNIVPPDGYFSELRATCRRNNVLIIADEVQTGFGRTGSMFASNGFARELHPDILVFGKGAGGIGIPTAGIFMRPELDVLEPWEHSVTSGFNPLAIVAIKKTIEIIESENLLQNTMARGSQLLAGLRQLEARHFSVMHACGIGLMCAFDLPNAKAVKTFIAIGRRYGLLLRGSRYGFGNTVKVRPPLIVTAQHIHEILAVLSAALIEFEGECINAVA